MPLTIRQPAKDVAAVVRGQLEKMATGAQFRTAQLRAAAPAALSLAAPHPVYNLSLDDVGSSDPLAKTNLTAWGYVILDGEQTVATAEALQSMGKKKPVFSHTHEGPSVASFGEAISLAEKLPELENDSYELAVLRIPALYVTALWLKGAQRGTADDLFIPLNPAPNGLKAEEKMTADVFLQALVELKAERAVTSKNSN